MRVRQFVKRCGAVGVAVSLSGGAMVQAAQSQAELRGYDYGAAVQKITQLFWLAETASVCGWASEEDALKFKHFSVRFLTAHVTGVYRAALLSMVTENGYEAQVRRVAQDGAAHNCTNARWKTGWIAYKAAAEARDTDF